MDEKLIKKLADQFVNIAIADELRAQEFRKLAEQIRDLVTPQAALSTQPEQPALPELQIGEPSSLQEVSADETTNTKSHRNRVRVRPEFLLGQDKKEIANFAARWLAQRFSVKASDIQNGVKKPLVIRARKVWAYTLSRLPGWTGEDVAAAIGQTTIIQRHYLPLDDKLIGERAINKLGSYLHNGRVAKEEAK